MAGPVEEQARYHDAAHAETQVVSFSDEEPEVAGMDVAGVEVAGMGVAGGMEAEAMAPDAREGLMAQAEGHMTQVQGWEAEDWEEEEAELALHEPAAAAAGAVAPHVAEAEAPHAAGRDDETQLEPEAAESAESRADDEVDGAEEGRGGAEAARRRAAGLEEAVGDVHAEGDAPDSLSFLEEDEESPNATLDHPPRPGHLQAVEEQSDSMPDATVEEPPTLQPGRDAAPAWRETAEQMVDMGFERAEVERALEECGGDFDSALEQLTQPAVPSPRVERRDATRVPQDARHDGTAGSQPSQLQPSQSQPSQLPRKRASSKGRTGRQMSQRTSAPSEYRPCPGCDGMVSLKSMDYHLEHQCKSRLQPQPQPQLSQQREQQERRERQEREQQQRGQQRKQQREQQMQERGGQESEQQPQQPQQREEGERQEREGQESDRQDPSPAFHIRQAPIYTRGAASPAAEVPSERLAGALADAGGNRVEGADPDAPLFGVGDEEAMEQEDETVEEEAAAMEQGEETMGAEEHVDEEEAAVADEETDEEREEEAEEADLLRYEPLPGSSDRGKCLVPETQPERCGLPPRTHPACCIGLPPRASLCLPRPAPCAPRTRLRLPRAPCPRSESPSDEMPPPAQPDQRFAVPPPPVLAGPVKFVLQAGFVPETQLSQ